MDYQEQADNFESASYLAALALANHIGSNVMQGGLSSHSQKNPDPLAIIPSNEANSYNAHETSNPLDANYGKNNPNYHRTLIALENAAEKESQKYNPSFNKATMQGRRQLNPGDPGFPGSLTRFSDPKTGTVKGWRVNFNPGIDRAVYAHELGHMISQNSEVGLAINKLKNNLRNNPKLGKFLEKQMTAMPQGMANVLRPVMTSPKMLAAGRLALPTALAAAIPGEDDAASAVAASLILASPTLIDEALATKNGLKIMADAGMPATAKQRARMAGAWGSYLAKPLTAALLGNVAGNVIEDIY